MSGPRITAEDFDPETGGFAYVMVDGCYIHPHLIAAAPEMANIIHDIYSWMLCTLPLDLRLRAQAELAALRDVYAKATNRDAEEVQNEHEEAAALSIARATGEPTP